MRTRNGRLPHVRRAYTVDDAVIDAADAVADMAERIQLNGPEPTYASEKLEHALSKAAEGLALCDVGLAEVEEECRRGHLNGRLIREELR